MSFSITLPDFPPVVAWPTAELQGVEAPLSETGDGGPFSEGCCWGEREREETCPEVRRVPLVTGVRRMLVGVVALLSALLLGEELLVKRE